MMWINVSSNSTTFSFSNCTFFSYSVSWLPFLEPTFAQWKKNLCEAKPAARRFYNRQCLVLQNICSQIFQADLEFFKCGTPPLIFYGNCLILQEVTATPPSPLWELNEVHDGYVIWRQRHQGCKPLHYRDCIFTSIGANLEIFHTY
jgi:hypothetical protein